MQRPIDIFERVVGTIAFLLLLVAIAGCRTAPDVPYNPELANVDWPTFTGYNQSDYAVTKAKREYLKFYPYCEVCGTERITGKKNEVHHRIPVHVKPELAATHTNLVTLCRTHHWWIGHLKNFKDYNTNLTGTIRAVRDAYNETKRSGKDE